MLPLKFRRSAAIVIPIFSAAAFFGMIEAMFKVGITENLASTGLTLGIILALLNIYLVWQNYNHLTP
jgi:hypothetical protein